uniref:Uncharacterized protein n=1 Tax=Globisporangium ultimum (strain ATCC 200006 / CBS 805.95 / DAOM BR144) TaxID=431595 RepID=K3WA68_GLOUD
MNRSDDDFEDDDGFAIVAPPPSKSAKTSKKSTASSSSKPVKSKKSSKSKAQAPPRAQNDGGSTTDSGDDQPLSKVVHAKAKAKKQAKQQPTKTKEYGDKPAAVKKKSTNGKAAAKPKTTKAKPAGGAKKTSKASTALKKAPVLVASASPHELSPRSPSPSSSQPPRPSGGRMLSVFDLCNDDDESANDEDNASAIGSEPEKPQVIDVDTDDDVVMSTPTNPHEGEETNSTAGDDNESEQDEGWSDHNRWYCNIC